MHIIKTSTCRHILDIFIDVQANQPSEHLMSTPNAQIRAISLRVHDGTRFTETKLEDTDEAQLLQKFWVFIAPNDVLIGPQAKYEVEFIRQRTTALGLLLTPNAKTSLTSRHGSCRRPMNS
jgi:hypothetical protein